MAGKDSRNKGSGRGLKGRTGFSGDDGRGVRGDDHDGGASTDAGADVAESLGRFEGRTSRSGPRRIESAAISEGEEDKGASRLKQGKPAHGAIDFGLSRAGSVNHASPSATKAEATLGKRLSASQGGTSFSG